MVVVLNVVDEEKEGAMRCKAHLTAATLERQTWGEDPRKLSRLAGFNPCGLWLEPQRHRKKAIRATLLQC